jgi:dihydroorotase
MAKLSKRELILRVAAGGTLLGLGAIAPSHFPRSGGADRFDLVIKGGEVLDPSQKLRGKRDIAIHHARIAAIETDIPAAQAVQTLNAAGKLVTPGLVDLNAHVFAPGGLPPDELTGRAATTTSVSAGDTGAAAFPGFKRAVAQAHSRIFAFIHISYPGLAEFPWEMRDIRYAAAELAARVVAENPDLVLGVKVRPSGDVAGESGIEPLRRAIQAAEQSGTKARVMCGVGAAPGELPALLDLLRPGDILTHAYTSAGDSLVQGGRVIPAALEAQRRGVVIDVGHGAGGFDYAVAEPALQQGLLPDTLSSDLRPGSPDAPGVPYLPWVMSKFLNLGLPLEQVVTMATATPGRIVGRVDKLGTLQVGAPADVALFERVEGAVEFVDARANKRSGKEHLRPFQTVRAGQAFARPSQSLFKYT